MTVDIEQLQRECETEIEQLEADVGRLLLSDDRRGAARAEERLAVLVRRRSSLALAVAERERQQLARIAADQNAERAAATARARALQSDRLAAGKRVDKAMSALAKTLSGYLDTCQQQQAAFEEASLPYAAAAARPLAIRIEGAFMAALGDESIRLAQLGVWEQLPRIRPDFVRQLGETDIDPTQTIPADETSVSSDDEEVARGH